MANPSVELRVEPSPQRARIHVFIRLGLLVALAFAGCSSVYWLLYLALPSVAALLIAQKGGPRYLAEDAPGAARVLQGLARAYAYLWLLTDGAPTTVPGGPIELAVVPRGRPTPASALLRLFYSLPALALLVIFSFIASVLWVAGSVVIVVTGTIPAAIGEFLASVLRYQFRLVAYHLSLVDDYPAFGDAGLPHAPRANEA